MDAIYSNYAPTFLYVDKYHFSSRWVYQEARIPYSMFRYIYSGSARFEVDGIAYDVKADDLFYIPQGSVLYCAAHENIIFVSVRFIGSIQLPEVDMLRQLWNITQLYNFRDQPQVKDWFEQMYCSAVSRATYKKLETRGYLNLICAAVARLAAHNEEEAEEVQHDRQLMEAMFDMKSIRRRAISSHVKSDPRIQILVDYLTVNPQKNLNRDEMCEMCGLSLCTLRRLFKQQTGKTIYEFVKENKMMYAAHLLVTTQEPISEIGYQLGYESPSYFGKTFHNIFGVSPQAYRKQSEDT